MRIWPVAILGAAVCGGAAVELSSALTRPTRTAAAIASSPEGKTERDDILQRFPQVVMQVSPAVVAVDAVKAVAADGSARNRPLEESGSGVLIRWPGISGVLVITNHHVVGSAAPNNIYITLADGRIRQPVRRWADPESDLAFLLINDPDLPTAELGDSDKVRRGQWVLAFGSPFGLNQTVTHGIISATNRGQVHLGSTIRIKEFLQTDAAINPGSSGGPLVDMEGKVIGINTAIASKSGDNSGVSFSIPANMVQRVARQLITRGRVVRGYLGVQLASSLEPAVALRLGLDRINGALVELVHAGTPAAAAGLQRGDVILKLEDITLRDHNHLINLISDLPPGQKVRLTVWRERQLRTVDVVIGEYVGPPQ